MDVDHLEGKSNALSSGGRHTVRTLYVDAVECVEEFDSATGELLVKRWKAASVLGRQQPWEFEFGEPQVTSEEVLLVINAQNPSFVNRDAGNSWEFKVRNIPYPMEVYQLSIDEEKQQLVLRTSNKKYFKRFHIPSLRRAGMTLDARLLELADYSNNTLTIRYSKPQEILQRELLEREQKMKLSSESKSPDCATQ